MSQSNTQLCGDSTTPHSSVDGRLSSGARETNSFADLILAREKQQRRIREALEDQNRQLRARLTSVEATNRSGEASAAGGASTGQRRVASPVRQHTIPIEEFITFVTEMKDLINCAQQADLVALHALQDRAELQNRDLVQRMTELESQMIAVQRRDEFRTMTGDRRLAVKSDVNASTLEEPSLQYLMCELDDVRQTVEETRSRLSQSEEAVEKQQAVVHLFEKDLNALEIKMVDVESLPALFRRETMTLEERYTDFTQHVWEELAKQQQHRPHQQQEQCTSDLMEDQLRKLEKQVQAMEVAVNTLKRNTNEVNDFSGGDVRELVSRLVEKRTQELMDTIDSVVHTKIEEVRACLPVQKQQSLNDNNDKEAQVVVEVVKTRAVEDDDSASATALVKLEARVREIEAKVDAMGGTRRSEASTLDEERVELLMKELEGATVLLEGAIARRAASAGNGSSSSSSSNCSLLDVKQVLQRAAEVETQVRTLEERLNHVIENLQDAPVEQMCNGGSAGASNVAAAAPAPTTAADASEEAAPNASRWKRACPSCHLQEAPDCSAADADLCVQAAGCTSAMTYTVPATPSALQASPSGAQLADVSPSVPPPPIFAPHPHTQAVGRQTPSTLPPFGPFKAPPVPLSPDGPDSVALAVANIRERKRQKEDAVAKVIAALRDIQQRFADLAVREPVAQRSSARCGGRVAGMSASHEDPAHLLESIASQKEAVYAKEKQLRELRNTLWWEIAQLEEDERELVAYN